MFQRGAWSVIIAGEMDENMSFGDWRDATPDKMREWSEAKLYLCMELGGSQYEPRARAELGRRQIESLDAATATVHQEVSNLTQSSTVLQTLTAKLVEETTRVHTEVAILSSSSDRLENLTKKLKNLTWALIFLTVAAVIVPVGIEVWKAYHEPQIAPVAEPSKPAK